jgi:predicted MPP superfamily phosphohydrolase
MPTHSHLGALMSADNNDKRTQADNNDKRTQLAVENLTQAIEFNKHQYQCHEFRHKVREIFQAYANGYLNEVEFVNQIMDLTVTDQKGWRQLQSHNQTVIALQQAKTLLQ